MRVGVGEDDDDDALTPTDPQIGRESWGNKKKWGARCGKRENKFKTKANKEFILNRFSRLSEA